MYKDINNGKYRIKHFKILKNNHELNKYFQRFVNLFYSIKKYGVLSKEDVKTLQCNTGGMSDDISVAVNSDLEVFSYAKEIINVILLGNAANGIEEVP